jgi:hypothetical protein
MRVSACFVLVLLLFQLLSSSGCDVDIDVDDDDLDIVTDTLPDGIVGTAYSFVIDTDGDADEFRLISGNLPPNIRLSDGGRLSGTPTTPGTFIFTIEVIDIFDGFIVDRVSKGFSLIVQP